MLMRCTRANSSSCMQVVWVYLCPFNCNLLFCSQKLQKKVTTNLCLGLGVIQGCCCCNSPFSILLSSGIEDLSDLLGSLPEVHGCQVSLMHRAFKQVSDTVKCRVTIWPGVRNCCIQSMFVWIQSSTVARFQLGSSVSRAPISGAVVFRNLLCLQSSVPRTLYKVRQKK